MKIDQLHDTELPLLRTKITPPLLPPEFVHRPRLTAVIDRGVHGPLTLLAAPAGFGKTNLLVEWVQSATVPVAWLYLEPDDNSMSRFFRYLLGAMQIQTPDLGMDIQDLFQSNNARGIEIGLTLLINEISAVPGEIILILDDFQVITDATILKSLTFLLKNIPHNLHLIIATRSEPAIDLTFLRARGHLVELGPVALRFTSDEVAQYFHQAMNLQISPETIQALEERTDGWITALQMAALSLNQQLEPTTLLANLQGDAHFLVDYLAEEVLDQQPEEIRQFLLRSAFLETLTGPLCEAVVKPDAQPGYGTVMLNQLEHAKLFITALDEKHEWYRYHPLFAEFLRQIQRQNNPDEIQVLQKRAALWFERKLNLDDAFRYALSSGDLEWTADLFDRNIETMVKTGVVFPVTRWIGNLPEKLIEQHPRLALSYAWGLIASYQLDDARYWVDRLLVTYDNNEAFQIDLTGSESGSQTETASAWNIHGGLAICQSTLALIKGDTEAAALYSRQAASYLDEENPFIHSLLALDESLYFILSGDTRKAIESLRITIQVARQANNILVMIIAMCQMAEMQALQGQLSHAWATLQKAQYLAIGPDGTPLALSGLVEIGFGEILFERNALADASIYLEHGIQITGPMGWLSNLDGLVSLARLRQAQGDSAASQDIINQASALALTTESSEWDDIFVSAISVRLALSRGDLVAAEQAWKKCAFPDFTTRIPLEKYPYQVFEYMVLTQVGLLTAIGRKQGETEFLHRALDLIETVLLEARRFQRVTPQIEMLIAQTVVYFSLGNIPAATKTLNTALVIGEPEGIRRMFLDGGQIIADLLPICLQETDYPLGNFPSPDFINHLMADFKNEISVHQLTSPARNLHAAPKPIGRGEELPVPLSARELEVLALIADGKSNQEISARLFLALNTVKRHVYNIFTKLNVKNRTQAVSKARRIGLID